MPKLPNMDAADLAYEELLYSNGFGLQVSKSHYYLCVLHYAWYPDTVEMTEENVKEICERTGSKTLELGDCLGNPFLKIHWTEKHLIAAVFTELLRMKFTFTVRCSRSPRFSHDKGDTEFEWWMVEDRIQEEAEELYHGVKDLKSAIMLDYKIFDVWNWKTKRGKRFCRNMRRRAGLPDQNEDTDTNNYFNWDENKGRPNPKRRRVTGTSAA
jgi:hypothetical protein